MGLDGERDRSRARVESVAGAAAPMLRRAGSLWAAAAARIVSTAVHGFAMDARRRCGSWCARAAMACRAPPTRRCAGRREHRRDDCTARPHRPHRQTRVLRARAAGCRGGRARSLRGCRVRWRARSAWAAIACCSRRTDGDALQLRLQTGDGERGPISATSAVCPRARTRHRRRPARRRARPADRRPAALAGVARRAGLRRRMTTARRRGRTPARCGVVRNRPADAVRPPTPPRSTRASSTAARRRPARRRTRRRAAHRAPAAPGRARRPLAATLAGIDLADSGGVPLGVNLLPPAQRAPSRRSVARLELGARRGRRCSRSAGGLWQVLDNRRAAADAFEKEVDRAHRAGAHRVARSASSWSTPSRARPSSTSRARGRPSAIEVIDELTRRLPDTTYLEKVAIENDRLTLIGLSSEASSLVRAPGRLAAVARTRADRRAAARSAHAAATASRWWPTSPSSTHRAEPTGARACRRRRLTAIAGSRSACSLAALALAYFVAAASVVDGADAGHRDRIADAAAARTARAHATAQAPEVERRLRQVRAAAAQPPRLPARSHAGTRDRRPRAAPRSRRRAGQPRQPQLRDHQPLAAVRRSAGRTLPRVTVQVRLRCGTPELATVLHALESGSPRVFVDNLNVLAQRYFFMPGQSARRAAAWT